MLPSPLLKQVENLSADSNFYEELFENMLDGVAYCKMIYSNTNKPIDFEYIKVNRNFEKITGLKDVEGKKVSVVIPELQKTNPELFEIYDRVSQTGKSEKTEIYIAQLNIWLLISVYSVKKGTFVAIFQNETFVKKASQQDHLQLEALSAAANAIIISNTNGIIEWVNPAFTKLTGYSAKEAIGHSTNLLRSGRQDPAFYKNLWGTISVGKVWEGKLINKKKSGELYVENQIITPVKDHSGKIVNYIAIKQDVTRQQELEDESIRARNIIASSDDAIFSADLNGDIMSWNKKAEEVYGYSKKEIIGKSVKKLIPANRLKSFYSNLEKIQNGGKVEDVETQRLTKKGKLIDVSVTISPIKQAGKDISANLKNEGEIIGYSMIYRDVTELKQAKYSLELRNAELETSKKALVKALGDVEAGKSIIEEEKARDEAMLESIGDGVFAVGTDEKFILMNKKAEELIGISAKNVLGIKRPSDINLSTENGVEIPHDKRPTYLALQKGITTSGSNFIITRKDKTVTPISLIVSPVRNKDGEIIGAIDVFRDITREKEIDRAKTEFVSIASHQLRTPLGISKWYIEAIYNQNYLNQAPPILKEYIDEIYKSNNRLLDLVRSLLLVSRIDQGRVKDSPSLIDITELVESIIKSLEVLANQHKVKIYFERKNNIPKINIDPIRLHEVVENLVINGIRYNVPNGKVYVILDRDKNNINLKVQDTGIGVSSSDKKNLFTKFFRTTQASLNNPEGTGLGLFVVKSYVEAWGGTVNVESTLGKGSTFFVTIPMRPKKLNEGKEDTPNEQNLSS